MTEISSMNLAEVRAAGQALLDRTSGDLVGANAERFTALQERAEQLRRDDELHERTLAEIRSAATGSGDIAVIDQIRAGDRPNHDARPGGRERDAGMRNLERAVNDGRIPAAGAETIEALMTNGAGQTWTRRWAAAAGDAAYERAFGKLVADPERGHLTWTPEESAAYRAVAVVDAEQRSMGIGTPGGGGHMVPLTLDPTILLAGDGSTNPLRKISRVVQTVTDTWKGVTSAGVTAEWTDEHAEVADASPTLAGPEIPVHKGDAFVPFSFEVHGDAPGFMQELAKLLQDGAEQLSATAYTTGSGVKRPEGIITGLVAAAATTPLIAPATAETLAAVDIFTVQNALPPRFQAGASWTANLAIINALRQFETSNGALKFPELANGQLLGRAIHENSNMDGSINPSATEQNYPLVYGDFSAGFVIADRIGTRIELIPHLVGPNRRPTGERGALLWFRTGSKVVIPNAFRMLSIPTAA
ncbi:phage major capsid protein [Mycolicibacter minnesotensis]